MSKLLVDVTDGVATLTLNNPAERNTMTAEMVAEITAAMDDAEANPKVGAVVVTGAAPAFCAGANLGNLAEATKERLMGIYQGFLRIAWSPLPTLAAVNGPAVGAGMNLALGCDVRIAGKSARFDSRFLQLGIHPGGGNTWMQLRIAGAQTAAATVLFGEVLDGDAAVAAGLAWKCVPDDELLAAAQTMAARAATTPKELSAAVKKTLREIGQLSTHALAVDAEQEPQLWSTRQPWFRERLEALQRKISKK
jgi:enoyl-CoA hydratase